MNQQKKTKTPYAFFVLLVALALCLPRGAWAKDPTDGDSQPSKDVPVEVVADSLEYSKEEKKIIGRGNVVVTYKDTKMQADEVEVLTDAKTAHALGHVSIIESNSVLNGEEADYDFVNHSGTFPKGSGFQFPWYGSGEMIEQVSKEELRVTQGAFTTCDRSRPHYQVISKNITIYPNDKIILRNVTIKILDKPVLWLPYLAVPLNDRSSPFDFNTGYSSDFGYYLLTGINYSLSESVKLKGHIDYRSKRGVAGGMDVGYDDPRFGRGQIITYLADDKRAPTTADVENPFVVREQDTRYRFSIRHRTDFSKDSNVIVNWYELSDEFILQEFFERENRFEIRPTSRVVFNRNKEDYGMYTEVVKQTNQFFSEIEKLPRLNFTWKNQPLFDTNMLYQHATQFTNFQKKTYRSSVVNEVVRFDTSHEWQYPFRIADSRVKITPYANARGATYSQNKFGDSNIARGILGHGIESRMRFQKPIDVKSNFMKVEINQLRHIIEPIARYDAIRADNVSPGELHQLDPFDALHKHDVITLALDNRLQTKRQRGTDPMQRVDLVSYNTFVNYELGGGRNGGSGLTDWGHTVQVRPYDWLTFEYNAIFDFTMRDFRESLVDVVLTPNDKFQFVLSQGYLSEDPQFPGSTVSNLVTADLIVKLNERWKLGGFIRTEVETGDVEEWELRAIRDLHDFLFITGFNVRNSDFNGDEGINFEAFVELRMKAFPSSSLGTGRRSSIVNPRIGRYYGGSNTDQQPLNFDTEALYREPRA